MRYWLHCVWSRYKFARRVIGWGFWKSVKVALFPPYVRWKNYEYKYTAVTKDQMIAAMRKAMAKTKFNPPEEPTP